jgi:Bacterial protein of unknown function (DUF916)
MRRCLLLHLGLVFVALAPAVPAVADDGFTWAVQPSGKDGPTGRAYFVYDVSPGQRIDDRVAITNLSGQSMTFTVYGADAFTAEDGGFGLRPATQRPTDVGSWAVFAERTYRIAAGKRAIIPFHVSVPANASPGDHTGGIVASVAQVRAAGDGQNVNVDRRVAARIYLRVAGEIRPSLQIDAMKIGYANPLNPFGTAPVVVSYRLRNTGNVRLKGTGQVQVRGPFGWLLAGTDPVDVPELLPGGSITVTEQINGIVPAGRLGVRVTLEPITSERVLDPVTRTAGVWAVPWLWLAAILTVVAVFIVRRLLRNRSRPVSPPSSDQGVPQVARTTWGTP